MSDPSLAQDALESWQSNAQVWDTNHGADGNKYWKALQEPCLARLLGPRLASHSSSAPCRVLELSTGNGICARWLAARGAQVTATDGSAEMLRYARARGDVEGRIEFVGTVDVTVDGDFAPYLERSASHDGYDIILMNMSIHDVATLEPLAAQLPSLLKKDGMFVAQMLHPVFMTSTYSRHIDISFDPATGERREVQGKLIKEYLIVKPSKMMVADNQVTPQIYFHRPICEILGTFFKAGLVVDALEEPSFTKADGEAKRLESTSNFTQLPALFAFRLRRG